MATHENHQSGGCWGKPLTLLDEAMHLACEANLELAKLCMRSHGNIASPFSGCPFLFKKHRLLVMVFESDKEAGTRPHFRVVWMPDSSNQRMQPQTYRHFAGRFTSQNVCTASTALSSSGRLGQVQQ